MIVNFDQRRSDMIAELKHSKEHRKRHYILEYILIELNVMIFHIGLAEALALQRLRATARVACC